MTGKIGAVKITTLEKEPPTDLFPGAVLTHYNGATITILERVRQRFYTNSLGLRILETTFKVLVGEARK